MRLETRCALQNWDRAVEVRIAMVGEGRFDAMQPAVFKEHPLGAFIQPGLVLPIETAQGLMDQLWQCGLRPTEGSGSAGALAATQRHLDDMRALVFKHKPAA
ncbi:MAG: hypothetical protein AB7F22_05300 [Reyranella sp.]|uniref:hypothetical protein n=1 Tax=Reyranella sp. TaxID=1929291 RepID=UPI003D0F9EAC